MWANPIPYNATWSDRKTEKAHNGRIRNSHISEREGRGKKVTGSEMNEEREVRRIGEPKLCHKVNTDNRGINDPCGQVLTKWV